MSALREDAALLQRALESGRIHSSYLLSGPGEAPRQAATEFARGLVCSGPAEGRPCDECLECRRSVLSDEQEPVEIDGAGKRGPLLRHVGDHPDLLWVERGAGDTRVRIAQVRAVQHALRLGSNEGGWRAAVIADAEWLNQEAQNALLRLLEEPPDRTCLVLVTTSAAGLLATIRSRCQRVAFDPPPQPGLRDADADPERRALAERLDAIARSGVPDLLDWGRGVSRRARRRAAAHTICWRSARTGCASACASSCRATGATRVRSSTPSRPLSRCRKDLDQRNANPQMVAERALFALQRAAVS